MINNKIRLLLTALLLAGSMIACSSADKPAKESQSEPVQAKVETAGYQKIPEAFTFTGTVQADHRITLSTKLMGRITYQPFEEGDYVKKGQVLVRIKSDNLSAQKDQVEANLAQANANLANVKTNYDRIKALFQEQSATQKEYDDIKTQYHVVQANVKALKSKMREINDMLDYAVIKSPLDGYIVRKIAEQGDMAAPGSPLLTVEDVHGLEVRATVPESQIGLFHTSDTVHIEIDAIGGKLVSGKVTSINPSGDMMSRQFDVKIKLTGKAKTLQSVKAGMFARVMLEKGHEDVISVPASALVNRGQLTGIYTLGSNNEVILRWVRTGRKVGSDVEILSGLSKGDRYIASYDGRLREGQKVITQ
ncbi:MAG TPA: efflux RND transporter periplasmic adaptor subunit [Balneolales bacterium]|nr:efflux RND transporter periplasmic adaptor subunit [Balneolales bacterium]